MCPKQSTEAASPQFMTTMTTGKLLGVTRLFTLIKSVVAENVLLIYLEFFFLFVFLFFYCAVTEDL